MRNAGGAFVPSLDIVPSPAARRPAAERPSRPTPCTCPSAPPAECSGRIEFGYSSRPSAVHVDAGERWLVLAPTCTNSGPGKRRQRRRSDDDDDTEEVGAASEMPPWLWLSAGGLGGLFVLGAMTGFRFGPMQGDDNAPVLTLSSFSVSRAAYEEIIPLFQRKWWEEKGQRVVFRRSYGGSSSQSRAVQDGLEADVVAFALGADISNLEKLGLVSPGWEHRAPNNAVFAKSVAVLVVRPGNPKNITGWLDLTKDGVQVIFSSPRTSGVAQWCFLAMYQAFFQATGSEEEAVKMLGHVIHNAPIMTRDAREASEVFRIGEIGDVLVTYEAAAIAAGLAGAVEPYIVPHVNISIDNVIALVDRYAEKHGVREIAEAFVRFCFSDAAQRVFADHGFRSITPAVARELSQAHPEVRQLARVADFGGWHQARHHFFLDDAGIYDAAERRADELRIESRRSHFGVGPGRSS